PSPSSSTPSSSPSSSSGTRGMGRPALTARRHPSSQAYQGAVTPTQDPPRGPGSRARKTLPPPSMQGAQDPSRPPPTPPPPSMHAGRPGSRKPNEGPPATGTREPGARPAAVPALQVARRNREPEPLQKTRPLGPLTRARPRPRPPPSKQPGLPRSRHPNTRPPSGTRELGPQNAAAAVHGAQDPSRPPPTPPPPSMHAGRPGSRKPNESPHATGTREPGPRPAAAPALQPLPAPLSKQPGPPGRLKPQESSPPWDPRPVPAHRRRCRRRHGPSSQTDQGALTLAKRIHQKTRDSGPPTDAAAAVQSKQTGRSGSLIPNKSHPRHGDPRPVQAVRSRRIHRRHLCRVLPSSQAYQGTGNLSKAPPPHGDPSPRPAHGRRRPSSQFDQPPLPSKQPGRSGSLNHIESPTPGTRDPAPRSPASESRTSPPPPPPKQTGRSAPLPVDPRHGPSVAHRTTPKAHRRRRPSCQANQERSTQQKLPPTPVPETRSAHRPASEYFVPYSSHSYHAIAAMSYMTWLQLIGLVEVELELELRMAVALGTVVQPGQKLELE
ncbi:PREDICTED: basic proline-rich protein-like, partial [Galeopterus variegatus]|uniref:Basic proline-rich protein-like n=1 Tax=Galeopterus variegatus TaxID=482537 RepID=A0ABM0SIP1_GALVR